MGGEHILLTFFFLSSLNIIRYINEYRLLDFQQPKRTWPLCWVQSNWINAVLNEFTEKKWKQSVFTHFPIDDGTSCYLDLTFKMKWVCLIVMTQSLSEVGSLTLWPGDTRRMWRKQGQVKLKQLWRCNYNIFIKISNLSCCYKPQTLVKQSLRADLWTNNWLWTLLQTQDK